MIAAGSCVAVLIIGLLAVARLESIEIAQDVRSLVFLAGWLGVLELSRLAYRAALRSLDPTQVKQHAGGRWLDRLLCLGFLVGAVLQARSGRRLHSARLQRRRAANRTR